MKQHNQISQQHIAQTKKKTITLEYIPNLSSFPILPPSLVQEAISTHDHRIHESVYHVLAPSLGYCVIA